MFITIKQKNKIKNGFYFVPPPHRVYFFTRIIGTVPDNDGVPLHLIAYYIHYNYMCVGHLNYYCRVVVVAVKDII